MSSRTCFMDRDTVLYSQCSSVGLALQGSHHLSCSQAWHFDLGKTICGLVFFLPP